MLHFFFYNLLHDFLLAGTLQKSLADLSDILSQMKLKAKSVKNFELKIPPTQNYVDTGNGFLNTLRENLAEMNEVKESTFVSDEHLIKAQALVDTMQAHIDGIKHSLKRSKVLLDEPY